MSATHMGMGSKPSLGAPGEKPGDVPRESTARASIPRRSNTVVKSYFISNAPFPLIIPYPGHLSIWSLPAGGAISLLSLLTGRTI